MVTLNHLVIDNVVTEALDQIIDIGLKNDIVERTIEDCYRHVNLINRELGRLLLPILGLVSFGAAEIELSELTT